MEGKQLAQGRIAKRRGMLHRALRGLCVAYYGWRASAADCRRRRAAMRRGVLKYVKKELSGAYDNWMDRSFLVHFLCI